MMIIHLVTLKTIIEITNIYVLISNKRGWDKCNFVPASVRVNTIVTERKRGTKGNFRPCNRIIQISKFRISRLTCYLVKTWASKQTPEYKPPNLTFQNREYQVRGLIFWGLTACWPTLFTKKGSKIYL